MDADGTIALLRDRAGGAREDPTQRPHRLAVGFYDLNGAGKLVRVHREELDVDGERTEVPALAGLPRPT